MILIGGTRIAAGIQGGIALSAGIQGASIISSIE
jgi:hypothetical protein